MVILKKETKTNNLELQKYTHFCSSKFLLEEPKSVLPISARGTARFENIHFSNVRSFAGNYARLWEIALVERPVFFESVQVSENSRSARLENFLLVMAKCARLAKNIHEQANNQKLMLVWRSRIITAVGFPITSPRLIRLISGYEHPENWFRLGPRRQQLASAVAIIKDGWEIINGLVFLGRWWFSGI